MKRGFLFLILLLAAILLAACGTSGDGADTTNTPETEVPRVTLIDAEHGDDYVIVRTDVKGDYAYEMSVLLQNAVKEATGVTLALRTDWYKDNYGFAPQPHEILDGDILYAVIRRQLDKPVA